MTHPTSGEREALRSSGTDNTHELGLGAIKAGWRNRYDARHRPAPSRSVGETTGGTPMPNQRTLIYAVGAVIVAVLLISFAQN